MKSEENGECRSVKRMPELNRRLFKAHDTLKNELTPPISALLSLKERLRLS